MGSLQMKNELILGSEEHHHPKIQEKYDRGNSSLFGRAVLLKKLNPTEEFKSNSQRSQGSKNSNISPFPDMLRLQNLNPQKYVEKYQRQNGIP